MSENSTPFDIPSDKIQELIDKHTSTAHGVHLDDPFIFGRQYQASVIVSDLTELLDEHRPVEKPKTLAEMTPEERRECVGMWAGVDRFDRDKETAVILEIKEGWVKIAVSHQEDAPDFEVVTPRFDLVRPMDAKLRPFSATPPEKEEEVILNIGDNHKDSFEKLNAHEWAGHYIEDQQGDLWFAKDGKWFFSGTLARLDSKVKNNQFTDSMNPGEFRPLTVVTRESKS